MYQDPTLKLIMQADTKSILCRVYQFKSENIMILWVWALPQLSEVLKRKTSRQFICFFVRYLPAIGRKESYRNGNLQNHSLAL